MQFKSTFLAVVAIFALVEAQDFNFARDVAPDDYEPGDEESSTLSSSPSITPASTLGNARATGSSFNSDASESELSSVESVVTSTASDGHVRTSTAIVEVTPSATPSNEAVSVSFSDAADLISIAPGAVGLAGVLGFVFAI